MEIVTSSVGSSSGMAGPTEERMLREDVVKEILARLARGQAVKDIDLLTIKELGGWRTLAMVQRYAHLTPGHLHAAVERLTHSAATEVARK